MAFAHMIAGKERRVVHTQGFVLGRVTLEVYSPGVVYASQSEHFVADLGRQGDMVKG